MADAVSRFLSFYGCAVSGAAPFLSFSVFMADAVSRAGAVSEFLGFVADAV